MPYQKFSGFSYWLSGCRLSTSVRRLSLLLLIAALCGTSRMGFAQFSAAEERGLPANSVFSGSDIDQVNLQNGNLHVSIPILTSRQRGGVALTWSLVFDTQTWIKQAYEYIYPNCGPGDSHNGMCSPAYYYVASSEPNIAAGWRLASPYSWQVSATWNTEAPAVTCPNNALVTYRPVNNWHVVEPNGTQHPLSIYEEIDSPSGSHCLVSTLQGPTTDGSGMYFSTQTGILTLKNGVQIQMTAGGYPGQYYGGPMLDPNGNEAGPNDTMNRPLVTTTTGPSSTIYTVTDSNGSPQTYTVNYETISLNPNICSQNPSGLYSNLACSFSGGGNPQVIQSVILPDGASYGFTYYPNSTGEIQQITLPTGATINYTYADDYQSKFMGTGVPFAAVGGRGVLTRTVTVNGSAYTWNYAIVSMGQNYSTTTVTDPLQNVAVHTFGILCVTNCNVTSSADVYESSTTFSDSQGNLLRTLTNTYTPDYDSVNNTVSDGRLTSQTTTLDNGQQSQKQTSYDSFTYSCNSPSCPGTGTRMNPVQVSEYDFGVSSPGSLLRTTNTAYQSFSIGGWTITKPQSVTVLDSSGNQAAQTTYEYDNYAHTSQSMQASGAIQHNASFGTSYTTRGNVTGVSRWRNTDGKLLTSTNQYDDAGNLISVIDPNGKQTSYSYTDSWANTSCAPSGQGKLYRTQVTNAIGQITTSTFNSCTGLVASTTDPNTKTINKTTSITYDLLNRTKQVTYPDGGLTTYCYSDDPNGSCYSASVWSATETDAINAAQNVVHTNIYDGLGRTIESQLVSDPQGVVYSDTVYDGDGRVLQVSNPYRSGDAKYWTTKKYDGIGRVLLQCNTDNGTGSGSCVAGTSYQQWSYTGNVTTSYDELRNSWQRTSDAAGRLTNVVEPGSLKTNYTYDVLNNLLKVSQLGNAANGDIARTRTFNYDSLSRLLCASNPENSTAACPVTSTGTQVAGTTGYSYILTGSALCAGDPSLPCSRTDARGITTSYSYDSLNRILSKSYSDGITASSCYQYDSSTLGIGRLGSEWTQSGPCPTPSQAPTAFTTMRTILAYDAVGRVLNEQQCTPNASGPGNCTTSSPQPFSLSYLYDLAGNPTSYTNGVNNVPVVGSIAFGLQYDSAGRLQNLSSSWNPTTGSSSSPLSLFTSDPTNGYTAAGAIQNMLLGVNIFVNKTYDSRLRTMGETATHP